MATDNKENHSLECILCMRSENNLNIYGQMNCSKNICVHNFCCLFSSGLHQNGIETNGLMGFLIEDIKKEVKRANKLHCKFCRKKGATLGCNVPSCTAKYHYPCGLKNEIFYEHFSQYRSFCKNHRPMQDAEYFKSFKLTSSFCIICLCEFDIDDQTKNQIISATCCKHSFFHASCVQNYALNSGMHYFKCPKCNNTELFKKEMLFCGIYLPDRDAQWEVVNSHFTDLEELRYYCDVAHCLCHYGRSKNLLDTRWEIMRCDDCGTNGTHLACSQLSTPMDSWCCSECNSVGAKDDLKLMDVSPSNPPASEEVFKRCINQTDIRSFFTFSNKTNSPNFSNNASLHKKSLTLLMRSKHLKRKLKQKKISSVNKILMKFARLTGDAKLLPTTQIVCVLPSLVDPVA